jgi:pantoate--beta-alanine ligase
MEILQSAQRITHQCKGFRAAGKTIGFVPTMGALHEGHLSLIRICRQETDVTIVSIFVNPNQFNDKNDLLNYPRMPEKDAALAREEGCDILFMPDEKEVYPEADTRNFAFGGLDTTMEGEHRPGHFNGVAQVVTRLFDIVLPHRAYFGLKDFQQLAILKKVTRDLGLPVELRACPIVREEDGLAMSSRNMLLTPEQRSHASLISKTLFQARSLKESKSVEEIKHIVTDRINNDPFMQTEYFEIADSSTLQPVQSWSDATSIIGCIAVRTGKIRLIDNIDFSS